MADNVNYFPSYSFSGWQANNPTRPLPAPRIDEQFVDISNAINQNATNLGQIRRSDGGLRNGIVGRDQLSPTLSIGFRLKGEWEVGQIYDTGDGVVLNGVFYSADEQHLSTPLNAPEQSGSHWTRLFAVSDVVVDGLLQMPVDVFTGDGFTTSFPLPYAPMSKQNLIVTIGGIPQPVSSYNIEGFNIVFLEPAPLGYLIEVRGFSTTAAYAADGSIETYMLKNGVVTTEKLAAQAVTPQKLSAEVVSDINSRALKSLAVSVGDGLGGGGTLDADFQINLSTSTAMALALAATAVQPTWTITAGAGLTGGGDASANRTIAISAATEARLKLADTALQQADLASYATSAQLTAGLATKLGKTEKAADSSLLNGQNAAQIIAGLAADASLTAGLATKLGKTEKAADSSLLNGQNAAQITAGLATSAQLTAGLADKLGKTEKAADSALLNNQTAAQIIAGLATSAQLTAGLATKLGKTEKAADSSLLNGQTAAQITSGFTPTSGLGELAFKSKINIADINATGSAGALTVLYGDGTWRAPSGGGGGGMDPVVYDPRSIGGDVFLMSLMTEGADAKIMTAAERTAIAANTTAIGTKLGKTEKAADSSLLNGQTAAQITAGLATSAQLTAGLADKLGKTEKAADSSLLNNQTAAQITAGLATSAQLTAGLANKLGKTEKAADSALLNGQSAAQLPVSTDQATAINLKLDKTGQAADSMKFDGKTLAEVIASASSVKREEFLISGTWTKPTGLSADAVVMVELWGGGGGGDTTTAGGSGGGGGGYSLITVKASDLPATVSVTIGAGAAPSSGSSVGGNTTFGAFATAFGGQGVSGAGVFQGADLFSGSTPINIPFATTLYSGGAASHANQNVNGGNAVYGGGGGAGAIGRVGGKSVYGGAGGGESQAGNVPGGGGGRRGSGASGKAIVTVIG